MPKTMSPLYAPPAGPPAVPTRRSRHLARLTALTLIGSSLGLLPFTVEAAAWTRPTGGGVLSLPVSVVSAEEGFNAQGEREDRLDFRMVEFAPYLELGLTDSLSFGLQPKYRRVEVETREGHWLSNAGLPEADLLLRQRLWGAGDAALSLQGLVKLPIEPDQQAPVALGRDQRDVALSLLFGNRHRLGGRVLFYNFDAGSRYRQDQPEDQIHANAFVGLSRKQWTVLLSSDNSIGIKAPEVNSQQVLTASPTFTSRKLGLVVSYRLAPSLGIGVNASRVHSGKGVGASEQVGLSTFFSW